MVFKGIKFGDKHITAEYTTQPPANYLVGGFIKYYTDARHPEYIDMKKQSRAPPVRTFKIRVDLFNRLMEVTITNVRRTRRN